MVIKRERYKKEKSIISHNQDNADKFLLHLFLQGQELLLVLVKSYIEFRGRVDGGDSENDKGNGVAVIITFIVNSFLREG